MKKRINYLILVVMLVLVSFVIALDPDRFSEAELRQAKLGNMIFFIYLIITVIVLLIVWWLSSKKAVKKEK